MAFFPAVKSLFSGNFKQAVDYAFVPQETIDASNNADRQNEAINQRLYDKGALSYEDWRTTQAHLSNYAFPDIEIGGQQGKIFDNISPAKGFEEGLQEGADNIRGAVGAAIDNTVGLTWRIVPWQIWALAAAYLLFLTSGLWIPILTKRK
jgi:hypothetical protein